VIDVYDASTATWSHIATKEIEGIASAIAVNNLVYITGVSDRIAGLGLIEILDASSVGTIAGCLSYGRYAPQSGIMGNEIVIFKTADWSTWSNQTDKMDLYNVSNGSMRIGQLTGDIKGAALFMAGGKAYQAGGVTGIATMSSKVYQLTW
jgi:hypothetical protein